MREQEYLKNGLVDLINSTGKSDLSMIEIGSYSGESAEVFLKTGKVKKITCIDPWIDTPNENTSNRYIGMENIEKKFDEMMKQFGSSVIKFKGTLDEYISNFDKTHQERVDLVYIDGNHSYDFCKHDILTTINVVRPTTAISGHDYNLFSPDLVGVVYAVNECFLKPDIIFCDTSWIVFTKTI